MAEDVDPERVARLFHETYERLAPEHGYEVRTDVGRRPFDALPENNRALMVATAAEVLRRLEEPETTPPPLVVVHWEDTTNCAAWTDVDEATAFDVANFSTDFTRCTNVGYLLRDDDECVVVAARASGNFDQVGLIERIPKGCVRSIDVLRP